MRAEPRDGPPANQGARFQSRDRSAYANWLAHDAIITPALPAVIHGNNSDLSDDIGRYYLGYFN